LVVINQDTYPLTGGQTVAKVQFNFTDKALNDLDELQKRIEAPSRAETVRYALRMLQWVVDETARGNKICLETDEGIRRVMIPFLPTLQNTPYEKVQ
jgi:hypothetical protein